LVDTKLIRRRERFECSEIRRLVILACWQGGEKSVSEIVEAPGAASERLAAHRELGPGGFVAARPRETAPSTGGRPLREPDL